jgi:PEGA domain
MHTTLSTSRTAGSLGALALAAVLAAVTMFRAAPARAATEAEQAEALIREGVRLRGQDQTARALPMFQKAYEISRTPRSAGQLGLCEMELGAYVDAERHLAEALAAPDHPWIAKNKPVLKRQLEAARANIGELVLTVSPAGAEVLLNGKAVDAALLTGPIHVEKGQLVVEVRATGFETAHDTLTITAGKRERRTFALVPAPAAVAATAPPETGAAAPAAGPAGVDANAARDASGSSTGSAGAERLAAWITGGVAVGALILGTVEAFNAGSKRDDFNNHTGTIGGLTYQDCGTAKLSAACQPLKDSYDQARTLSIVGFAAAGALAVTSAVLFVLSSPDHERGSEVGGSGRTFACVPDVGVRGVGCAFRF